jgi:hypothetical protein
MRLRLLILRNYMRILRNYIRITELVIRASVLMLFNIVLCSIFGRPPKHHD